jgi:HPt (histidine-containing phosphotransfer) domain-containing protein
VVAELRKLTGGADLYSRLVELFRSGSAEALVQLHAALGAASFQSARAVCHRLKSSAANVGAVAFSRHVAALEQLCAAADAARAQDLLGALQAAHSGLMTELAGC